MKGTNLLVGSFEKIRYWKSEVTSKTKYHLSIGNKTVMATLFLGLLDPEAEAQKNELVELNKQNKLEPHQLFLSGRFKFVESMTKKSQAKHLIAVLLLDKTVFMPMNSFFIGSRLELGEESKTCRMAFTGKVIQMAKLDGIEEGLGLEQAGLNLHLYKEKFKEGVIERFNGNNMVIVKDMFGPNSNLTDYLGMELQFEGGKLGGTMQAPFAKKGKFKVLLDRLIEDEIQADFIGCKVFLGIEKDVVIKK